MVAKQVTKQKQEVDIEKLKKMKMAELTKLAHDLDVEGASNLKKQEMIYKVLQASAEKEGNMFGEGVLDV